LLIWLEEIILVYYTPSIWIPCVYLYAYGLMGKTAVGIESWHAMLDLGVLESDVSTL
jgi:hypothetical protein